MKRCDVLRRLDSIKEMSDQEIAINPDWIREVATAAYAHLKRRDEAHKANRRRKSGTPLTS